MPRLAANLTTMYTEHPFLDRFAVAAKDGFRGVEFQFPYDFPVLEIKARLAEHGLALVLFNAPPGDWRAGERGLASLPGREAEFRHGLDTALEYAAALGNRTIHVMAGLIRRGQDRAAHRHVYLENLAYAARTASSAGVTIVIEPINTRDIPGFLLNRQDDAQGICAEIGAKNLKVQFDCYHCQIVEGDIATKLKRNMAGIGHIQIAGVPERHEPDIGEVNYPYLLDLVDALGYQGWIGCEYRPRAGTSQGLGWARQYLKSR